MIYGVYSRSHRDGNANKLRNKYSKTVGSISSNRLFYGLQFFIR